MDVHLLDGTYELFRHHFALPSHRNDRGEEVAATRGVLASVLSMIAEGATHLGVATDHVIESFRNALWPGYKTGEGVEPDLLAQFTLLEDTLRAMGVTVWAMVDQEADDALAAAAAVAARDRRARRVVICTPDKDLAQCVRGRRVVQLDRRKSEIRDAEGVVRRFGVPPGSIPDWLALVGDSADGFPGLPGWGATSASAVLARYGHLERIPRSASEWEVRVRGAFTLAATLEARRDEAMLFRTLATLRTDAPVGTVDEWRWTGPTAGFARACLRIDAPDLVERAQALAPTRRSPRRSP